jgi:hypothetical protein
MENQDTYLVAVIAWGSVGWGGADLNHRITASHKK